MIELWKSITGYDNYAVSNLGKVKNLSNGKVLKPINAGNGYLRVGLYSNGKQKLVSLHRLVANAFIPNYKNLPQINHKNENKADNCVENLEWCTPKYNSNYGTKVTRVVNTKQTNGIYEKFKDKIRKAIYCVETRKIYPSIKIASEITGLDRGGLSKACTGAYKTCGGYHWSFCDKGVS